jgi:PAS domain S-box-containing protein
MQGKTTDSAEEKVDEIRQLRNFINDLLSLLALPAMWSERQPPQIIETLLDALLGILRLDFIYVRLKDEAAAQPLEVVRLAQYQPALQPQDVGRALATWLTSGPFIPPVTVPNPIGDGKVSLARFSLGIQEEAGLVMAGSGRADFPTQTETLLLNVAANQAAIALKGAQLASQRKQAEAEIRRHKDQLTAFFENASLGLHWVDAGGIIRWANQAELEMLGYPAEEYIGQPIAKFHADQNVIADILARLSRGEKLREYEARLKCKDGSERIVSINSSVHWEEGRFVHTQCFTQDVTERKQAEAALQESYQFNQTVLDSMSEHIAVLDQDGQIIAVNRAWQRFAQTNSEIGDQQIMHTGMNYLAVCRNASGPFSDLASAALEGIEAVLKGSRSSFILEYPCHSPQEERWFLMSVTPLPTSRGGAVIAHLDITARKQAEAKLAEQQAQFLTLAESIPQLAWMAGPNGYIHWYNRRWYEYTGTTPEQMEGWGWRSVHDPSVLPQVLERWQASLNTGNPFEMVFPLRGADGVYRPFLTRVMPQRNQEGQIIQWFGTNTDIDEVKRVEAALRQSEQRARFLAQASADFAEITDYKSTLQKVASIAVPSFADWCAVDLLNPDGSLQRLAVKHTDPAKVRLAHELMERYPPHPDDPHGVPYVVRSGMSELMEEIPDELLVQSARDEEHLCIARALGLRSYICVPMRSKGRTLGVLTFVTAESGRRYDSEDLVAAEDLGRRAAIAIENANLYRTLQEADRRKDEFLATLAHELRNPLAPIRTGLHVLKLAKDDPTVAENARTMMDRQLNHMVRLVDDLLDVSRITRGKLELRKERVELAAVVQNAVEASRPLIDQQGHELIVKLPPTPVYLEADATRLTQVLQNLLNNAAKYSERAGHIWLIAAQEAEEIVVSVKDTGIGIPASHLPRIFDMFSQIDSALEKAQGGLGIGLSLVKGLVEMHGGTIAARSEGPGHGSEFVIRLPLLVERKAAKPQLEQSEEAAPPNGAQYRILVVDDNEDSMNWLATMLEMMGNEVRTAHDGEAGIVAAAEFRPDLILMDIGMPKMNGYEAAHRIRQEPWGKQPMLVALTGWGSEDDRRRTQEAGFNRHLVKPVDPAEIEALLAELPDIETDFVRPRARTS